MNSLDYVEAVARQHEREQERDWAARFREQHPGQDGRRDARWSGFIHRWAGMTTGAPASDRNDVDDRLVRDREIDR